MIDSRNSMKTQLDFYGLQTLVGRLRVRPSKMRNCLASLRPPVRPKIDDDWISMDDVFDDDLIAMDDRLGPNLDFDRCYDES